MTTTTIPVEMTGQPESSSAPVAIVVTAEIKPGPPRDGIASGVKAISLFYLSSLFASSPISWAASAELSMLNPTRMITVLIFATAIVSRRQIHKTTKCPAEVSAILVSKRL